MTTIYDTEAFDALEEYGYVSEMVEIIRHKDSIITRPAFDLETCRSCGYERGTKLRFNDNGGYEAQREHARKVIGERIVTVDWCHVDSWLSYYAFQEIDGAWNTVMFEKVD